LRIGEAARLVGVTTKKTIRHYEKVRLLGAPQRSEAGYRLYAAADDLLRLQRVRRLQSLGLSLDRIKAVSASPAPTLGCWRCWRRCSWRSRDSSCPPKNARSGSGRRWTGKTPNSQKGVSGLKLAKECLGDYPKEASLSLVGQERKIWATLEAFDWPEE
jgi:hypothetical protein